MLFVKAIGGQSALDSVRTEKFVCDVKFLSAKWSQRNRHSVMRNMNVQNLLFLMTKKRKLVPSIL